MSGYYAGADTANGPALEVWLHERNNVSLIQTTPSGVTVAVAYMGIESEILEWNELDPPDAAEKLRNEVIYSYQHNRNPFIDHPEWARCVFTNTECPVGNGVLFQNGFE